MIRLKNQGEAPLPGVDDAELIRKIQTHSIQNSKSEVGEIYRRYKDDVFRMTRSLFDYNDQGKKDAEDLFQEAWRQAFEKIDRYNLLLGKSFGTWVKGIADNLFLENYRSEKKRRVAQNESFYLIDKGDQDEPLDDSPNAEQLETSGSDLEQNVFRKDDLKSALSILSPTEKEILIEWLRTYDKNDPGKDEHVRNLQRLSEKFSVQSESIRKIKQRAVEKIQNYFNKANFK